MMETISSGRCFGGSQGVYAHDSSATGARMEFAVYQPPRAASEPCPVVWYLSGLTCNWENVTVKAGFQRMAAVPGLTRPTARLRRNAGPTGIAGPAPSPAQAYGL